MLIVLLLALQSPPAAADGLWPLLTAHCIECHSGQRPKGDFDLSGWADGSLDLGVAFREPLQRVRERLASGEMPPPSQPRPDEQMIDRALEWLDAALPAEAPARPNLRRLNRVEYERSVRDLLDVHYPARELFPADDVGALFDNDAAVASASELAVERWIEAAERIAQRALPALSPSVEHEYSSAELDFEGGVTRHKNELALYSGGAVLVLHEFARDGRYRIRVRAWGDQAGPELPRMSVAVEERLAQEFDIAALRAQPEQAAATITVEAGLREVRARFVNDYYVAAKGGEKAQDRNLHVLSIAIEGPLDPPAPTSFSLWVDAQLERGSFRETLAGLSLRLWRRPPEAAELDRLARLSAETSPARERLRAALVGLLASPNFLYRVEERRADKRLSAFELATRLSYFLWASAPDAALLDAAASGELQQPAQLVAQIQRLLRDARSRSLVEEFAAQWLGWRALEHCAPDPRSFPQADAALLLSMRQECEAFFEAMLREDRALDEFIDADFAFVDERLSKLYGIEGVQGEGLRRVHLTSRERGGLLGMAAILTATSNPTRTAPVKRGKWILETLLGEVVPPPPPGVGALAETAKGETPKTLRAQLALHRANQDCAGCHVQLDPLGFALEQFDAIGSFRSSLDGAPIDSRGELADGTRIEGVIELKRYLRDRAAFPQALARALFSYALGRAPTRAEQRELKLGIEALAPSRLTLSGVIETVCTHSSFQRQGAP